jgi:probable HAF family extracellular repeat protein
MNGIKIRLLPAIVVAVGATLAAQAQAAPQRYSLTILEPLDGLENSWAGAIDGKGRVAFNSYTLGVAEYDSTFRVGLWNSGTVTPVNDDFSSAWDINYSGWMAGATFYGGAAIFNGASVVPIKTGATDSRAESINNRGNVVGWTYDLYEGTASTFLYKSGVVTDLGKKGVVHVSSINDRDQVAGQCRTARPDGNDEYSACIYQNSRTRLLTTGGLRGTSWATDINLAGHTIGSYTRPGVDRQRGFLYANGTVTDLGYTMPNDINNAGTIVGATSPRRYADPTRAFIRVGGKTYDLNTLTNGLGTYVLQEARQINEGGEIVGTARSAAGRSRAFVLRPVGAASESAID